MRRKVVPRFQLNPKRLHFGSAGEGNDGNVNVFSSSTQRVRIEMVAAGDAHALAVTTTGEMYAWGRGTSGQLGNGGTEDSLEPERIRGFGDSTVKDGQSGRARWVDGMGLDRANEHSLGDVMPYDAMRCHAMPCDPIKTFLILTLPPPPNPLTHP